MSEPSVSLIIPVFNDEGTVRPLLLRAAELLEGATGRYEILVVNDGSPDRSGEIADEVGVQDARVRVIHHSSNLGYGAALRRGLAESRYEWIGMVDGDNEYDVFDLRRMLALRDHYRLIISFRYKKLYSTRRIFISYVYNVVLRWLFRTPFRDVSTGIRVVHRSVLREVALTSNSPFLGAELAIKAMLMGFPVGEVGIQTFPRTFGRGSSTSLRNIWLTIRDMLRVRREIFSDSYRMPQGRVRGDGGNS